MATFNRDDPPHTGWCFGLPAGITSEQWPLDPDNGYPLVHAFTLLLPEDYRCHGADLVALSFFGTSFDMDDGGPETEKNISAAFTDIERPQDPNLEIFWIANKKNHPHLFRMRDPLDCKLRCDTSHARRVLEAKVLPAEAQ